MTVFDMRVCVEIKMKRFFTVFVHVLGNFAVLFKRHEMIWKFRNNLYNISCFCIQCYTI